MHPSKWATVDGIVSDGKPAFIPKADVQGESMTTTLLQGNYIKGAYKKSGFFHFETREGNEILKLRIETVLSQISGELDWQRLLLCCGSKEKIAKLTNMRNLLRACRDVIRERLAAPIPFGATKTTHCNDVEFYSSNGVWLYPSVFNDMKVEKSYDNIVYGTP